jgi:hypothetical protein
MAMLFSIAVLINIIQGYIFELYCGIFGDREGNALGKVHWVGLQLHELGRVRLKITVFQVQEMSWWLWRPDELYWLHLPRDIKKQKRRAFGYRQHLLHDQRQLQLLQNWKRLLKDKKASLNHQQAQKICQNDQHLCTPD